MILKKKKKNKKEGKQTLFMLTTDQLEALDPLFDKIKSDNELGKAGSILLQPHLDGRVVGAYLAEWRAELVNEVLRR